MNNILLRKSVRIVLATLSTIFVIILIWIMLDCFPRDVIVEKKAFTYETESTLNYIGNENEGTLKYLSGAGAGTEDKGGRIWHRSTTGNMI